MSFTLPTPLALIDGNTISEGLAHTPSAPEGCHPLLRMTREQLARTFENKLPQMIHRQDERILATCFQIKTLIDQGAHPELIYTAFSSLSSHPPFEKFVSKINTHIHRNAKTITDAQFLHLENEMSFLFNLSNNTDLWRFQGYLWANLVSMNSAFQHKATNQGGILRYITLLTEATIAALTDTTEPIETYGKLNPGYLAHTQEWMNALFRHEEYLYQYTLVGDTNIQLPLALTDAILCFIVFHVARSTEDKHIKDIHIQEVDSALEISGTLSRGEVVPDWIQVPISNLLSYGWSGTDGRNFLMWLLRKLPDILSLQVRWERVVFRIAGKQ